jgi:ABC-type nitrate/sulfonate/bicarbonate transport system substrate-binding protein
MTDRRGSVMVTLFLLAAVLAPGATVRAQPQTAPSAPTLVRVIAFDGGWNLPVWAAQRQGYFEANHVAVQIAYTPNSGFLVTSLFDGKSDIALALVDNLIAYQEGQGEAAIPANPDLTVFMGGDGGFLAAVAAPSIHSFADLKGKTLSVDAMTTGAAFVLRELVARGGVADGDVTYVRAGGTANRYNELLAGKHDATLLRTPFEVLAQNRGYHVLANVESLGAYQGTVGYVRQSYARDHDAQMTGFLKGYKAGLDFVADPGNRGVAEALLVANIRDMTPALAKQSYDLLLDPQRGLTRDLKPDAAGIATVLALRSKYAKPPRTLTDPLKYVDLTWYNKAFATH